MQNDNEKFDLLVRSLMQDAEEPVSPRVWEGVSAGLDSRKRRPVFVWYAAGLAAAAALVLGVVLSGTHNSNLPIHIDNVALVPSVPEDKISPGEGFGRVDIDAPARLLAENTVPAAVPAAAADRPGTVEALLSASRPEEETVREPDREEAGRSAAPAVRNSRNDRNDTEASAGDQADPFARLQWEDEQERQGVRVAVSFGGSMESNGNPKAPGIQAMRAPANQKLTHTIIQQTGATSAYAIPVSAGLNVRIGTGGRWSFGTGLSWTLLQRSFYGTFRENDQTPVYSEIHHTLHYVGIPVNAYYTMLQGGQVGLYGFAGGSVEKALSSRFRDTGGHGLFYKESVDGVQFSLNAGFGVQFRLADRLGLYVDPSLRWYIPGNQPKSIRTQQPLMMNFEVGLRFDL